MNLGDLEFKLDDFHEDKVLEGPGGPYVPLADCNTLLGERLNKIIEGIVAILRGEGE